MSKATAINLNSTPGSVSRRSGRTSRPLEEGIGGRSSSAGGTDVNKEGYVGMSVTAPPKTATMPPNATPWMHPDELPFVRRDDWTQELMLDYLARKTFTVPPNVPRSKDPFFTIMPRNAQPVMVPRRYRAPVLFLAKFQWESIRIVLTASDPVTDWNNCKYEIIHISRVCQHFFEAARNAAEMKGSGALSRTWRCPLIDRVLVRFWNHWFLSEDSWLKAFYKEFGEEDYEQDILEKDWQRWALKGHKGFQLTKEEVTDGITADQFTDGLTKTYGGWTWVVTTPSEVETSTQGPEDSDTPAQARSTSREALSLNPTAVPATPEIPDLTRSQERSIVSASSDNLPPTQLPPPLAPTPTSKVVPSATSGPPPLQATIPAEIHETTPSVLTPVLSTTQNGKLDVNAGTKRIRDDTDVDMDKQTKKAKRKSNSPEPFSLPPPAPAATQGSTLPTDPTAAAVYQSQSGELSSSIDANDGEASTRENVHSAMVSSTVVEREQTSAPVATTVFPNLRERASSIDSVDSILSELSSLRRSVSNTPPPQSLTTTAPPHSGPFNGDLVEVAAPSPLPTFPAPTMPDEAVPVSLHVPLPTAAIPSFIPEGLEPVLIDRDMSVSPVVRSAASSVVKSTTAGEGSIRLPDHRNEAGGATCTCDDASAALAVPLTTPSLPSKTPPIETIPAPARMPMPIYQAQHYFAQSYIPHTPNSGAVPPIFPGQTMTTDGTPSQYPPLPTPLRPPTHATDSPISASLQVPKSLSVLEQQHFSNQSILHPALQKSSLLPPSEDTYNAPLTGTDINLMNLTNSAASQASFPAMTAFAQAGLPDPHEKTQKLHASLLVRDLLDFIQSSWKRHRIFVQGEQGFVQGERGPVFDARTRHIVLDGDHAMSVDQRFVIFKNSVLAIVNRFDGLKADQLEKEIADVDSKLKHIFDETWAALNLPSREEWAPRRATRDADVQVTAVEVGVPPKASIRNAAVQTSLEPVRQLFDSVSIQTEECTCPHTPPPPSRPSVSPDATMVDLREPKKDAKTVGDDISVKEAMASIMDMVHDFVESSRSSKEKEQEDSTESLVLSTVMAEFKAMKDDLRKAQQTNREELQAINELHRNEVKSLKEELDHREQQRKIELVDLKSQHLAEVETLRGTIRTMEKERERLVASENEATRVQPQELLDLRRRISLLESLPRSPVFAPDHVMASPPLSAGSISRSEFHTAAPKMQAHPLSHLLAIDGDDTPVMPFSPRAHIASMREGPLSKPGTPLPSERSSVSRRESMDIMDEPNIPMPVKAQRKPHMFAPRPSAG